MVAARLGREWLAQAQSWSSRPRWLRCSSRPAPAATPPGFVGLSADDLYGNAGPYRDSALDAQRTAGVKLLRVAFSWAGTEVAPNSFDFTNYDRYVREAAARGITMLPGALRRARLLLEATCRRRPARLLPTAGQRRHGALGDAARPALRTERHDLAGPSEPAAHHRLADLERAHPSRLLAPQTERPAVHADAPDRGVGHQSRGSPGRDRDRRAASELPARRHPSADVHRPDLQGRRHERLRHARDQLLRVERQGSREADGPGARPHEQARRPVRQDLDHRARLVRQGAQAPLLRRCEEAGPEHRLAR